MTCYREWMVFIRSWMRHCDNELTTTLVSIWLSAERISCGRRKKELICCTRLRERCEASHFAAQIFGRTFEICGGHDYHQRATALTAVLSRDIERTENCQSPRGWIVFLRSCHPPLMQQKSGIMPSPISFHFSRFRAQSLAQCLASWRRRLRIPASSARSPLTCKEETIELRCAH